MLTLQSNTLTIVDQTDNRKLEVYIKSNMPTVQILNTNTGAYSPDWSSGLTLTADVYLDSREIQSYSNVSFEWSVDNGSSTTQVSTSRTYEITDNKLASNPILTYICVASYQNVTATSRITFIRTDTGRNGVNGTSAPAVQAQYSVSGSAGWTTTLDTSIHKYIRYSYDGGQTWTAAIKMVGEDGTSVNIKGTATYREPVINTSYFTLVYDSATITGAVPGDAYLLDGNLYVCVDSRDDEDYFMNVGQIQGPQGNDGKSSYVFIRYATNESGENMTASPNSTTTHIGICTVNTNVAPTTAASYVWSKFVGDNAKSIILSGTSQIFKVSQDATPIYTPATITVTAQTVDTTVAIWEYSTNGGISWKTEIPTGVSLNEATNTLTITGKDLTSNMLVIRARNGIYKDVYTIYKVFDGAAGTSASMAFLTNENISVAANASGVVNNTTTLKILTSVVAYNGTVKQMPELGTLTGIPSGMKIEVLDDTLLKEKRLAISFESNATLGSPQSNSGTITIPVTSPVVTNLMLSWSKINSGSPGATGSTGPKGDDAYTVILTNESHVFAGDVSNAIAGSTATQILAYSGSIQQDVTITSINGKAAATTDTDTGITGLKFKCSALSGKSPTITFTCTTDFISANGSIPIVLSVGGISITKMFTYAIAFKGAVGKQGTTGNPGSPATAYWLVSSASVVQKSASGTVVLTPSTLTFTGKSKTGTSAPIDYDCRWIIAYSTDGTTYTNVYISSADESSKTFTVDATYKAIRVRMCIAGGAETVLDEQIIPIVTDGAIGTPGMDAVTFQIYSSNGYALSTNAPTVTLQTFAYVGDVEITAGATYQWYVYNAGGWAVLTNATNAYLTISREDVEFSKSYMCRMTFDGVEYTSVATIDDKNDENKVFTTKPSNYAAGDLWIVGVDYAPSGSEVGTLLRAEHTNTTYEDADWVTATKYDDKINELQDNIATYNQYFSFDSTEGLKISAKDDNGTPSQFSTSLTNERLSFNYGNEAIAYINGTKMNIKEAEIESPLTVTGKYSGSTMLQAPVINIGNFSIIVESNGSLSIVANT